MKKLSFSACILLVLCSCSRYTSNGENLYLKNHNGPVLEVPPPLTSANISNFYNLPQQHQDPQVDIKPPVPLS